MGVPKEQNPKALALFVSSLIKLHDLGYVENLKIINSLLNRLIELRSPNNSHFCWGYNFDWQTRFLLVPKYTPNAICTVFVGNAFLDAHEKFPDSHHMEPAIQAGRFLLEDLNISRVADDKICFSYTPLDHERVHNTNFISAAFLGRLYSLTGEKEFLEYGLSAIRYSSEKQNPDGSWYYGEGDTQRWIDNFHTGYNLVALKKFSSYAKTDQFLNHIEKGLDFYIHRFFKENGIARYFHNRTYPIDIHSIAQSIITLMELKEIREGSMGLAISLIEWALKNMRDDKGYFYYRAGRIFRNRIPYMRWSQAWMLYALTEFELLNHSRGGDINIIGSGVI